MGCRVHAKECSETIINTAPRRICGVQVSPEGLGRPLLVLETSGYVQE